MKKVLLSLFLLVGVFFSNTLFAKDIVFEKDIATAFSKAKKENKLLMVMVESKHCRWCVKMKNRTLSDNSVQKRLEPYILVKLMREDANAADELPIIDGVPTIFFMKANKEVVEKVVGYFNVEDFISYIDDVEKKVPLI